MFEQVCCNREGVSKGYAFVHYKTVESAEQAISTLNNKVMDDKRVQVELWASREDRGNPHGEFSLLNLHIKKHFSNFHSLVLYVNYKHYF